MAPEIAGEESIPEDLLDAARKHLKEDFLVRYFCKKYSMPPTDPRMQAYTVEEMMIEYVADAVEDDRLMLGVGGKPVRQVTYKGEKIYQTGSAVFDAYEREWVDQGVDDEIPDGTDLLDLAKKQVDLGE